MMFNLYLAAKDNLALDMRLTDTKYNQEYIFDVTVFADLH